MSHTPGPLTVRIDDEWPFTIRTFNAQNKCVFSRDMPAYSTVQKNAAQAMSGYQMGGDKDASIAANDRAVKNEILRAAAPELLQALEELLAVAPAKAPAAGLLVGIEDRHAKAIKAAREAVKKARGKA